MRAAPGGLVVLVGGQLWGAGRRSTGPGPRGGNHGGVVVGEHGRDGGGDDIRPLTDEAAQDGCADTGAGQSHDEGGRCGGAGEEGEPAHNEADHEGGEQYDGGVQGQERLGGSLVG